MTTYDYATTLAFPKRHFELPALAFRLRYAVAAMIAVIALLLLSATTMGASPQQRIVVQPGDTLWSIAQSADPGGDVRSDIDRIISLNQLQSASVYPGERLLLPQF